MAGVGFAEMPAPGFRVGAPDHRGAALDGEPRLLHRGQRPQIGQDGDTGRQQRFAHVGAGEAFPLQQDDRIAPAGQQSAGAGAGRAAADDDDGFYGIWGRQSRLVRAVAAR